MGSSARDGRQGFCQNGLPFLAGVGRQSRPTVHCCLAATRWAVQVAEPAAPEAPPGRLTRAVGRVRRAFAAVEALTGFSRDQLALGMQVRGAWQGRPGASGSAVVHNRR